MLSSVLYPVLGKHGVGFIAGEVVEKALNHALPVAGVDYGGVIGYAVFTRKLYP